MNWSKGLSRTFGKEVAALYMAYVEELVDNGLDRDEFETFLNEYSSSVGAILNILMLSRSGMTVNKYRESADFLFSQRRIVEEILNEVEPGSRILDIGCGMGLLTCLLALNGLRTEGCDISAKSIKIANRFAYKLGYSVDFTLTDSERLPYEDNGFDYIIFNSSIHEISDKDRPQVFREAYRILRKGGKIIIVDQEGVAPFDTIRDTLKDTGFEMENEQPLQLIFDHGKTSNAIKCVYVKSVDDYTKN